MEFISIILFVLVIMIANIFQGITGFAGTIIAMPFSIMLIGLDDSKYILNFVGILASLVIVVKYYKDIDFKELKKIVIYMTIGVIAGLIFARIISADILLQILPIFIIVIGVKGLLFPTSDKQYKGMIGNSILLVAGIIHGMFIVGGPILIIYAKNNIRVKQQFRATLSAVWLFLNSFILVAQVPQMTFTSTFSILVVGAVIALFIGVKVGEILHERLSQAFFMKLTNILLIVSGLSILLK